VIRWMCTHRHVSRSPPWAIDHLTGEASRSARPDACHPPARPGWLSAGVPELMALSCGAPPHGDCRLPVRLPLPCVSARTRVAPGEPGHPCCSRRSALDRCPNACLDAVAYMLPRGLPPSRTASVWLVPPAVALGHPRGDAPGHTGERGGRRHGPPLAPCERRGLDTGAACGPRRCTTPERALSPHAVGARPLARPCPQGGCRCTRSPPPTARWGSVEATRDPGSAHDARHTRQILPGWSAAAGAWPRAVGSRPSDKYWRMAGAPAPARPSVPRATDDAYLCGRGERRYAVDRNFKRYFATTAARRCVSRVSSLSPN